MKNYFVTGCPNKHGNSVTNSISSLLRISLVIPDIKSHNIMPAGVCFMKTVNGCKDVSIMSPQDEQYVCILSFSRFTEYNRSTVQYNRKQTKHKQINCKHSRRKPY